MYLIAILFFSSAAVGNAMWQPEQGSSSSGYAPVNEDQDQDEDQNLKKDVDKAVEDLAHWEKSSIEYGFLAASWPNGHNGKDKCQAVKVGGSDSSVLLIRDSCADKLKKKKVDKMAITPRPVATSAYPVLKVYRGYKQSKMSLTKYAFLKIDKEIDLEHYRGYDYSTTYTKYSKTERPSFP